MYSIEEGKVSHKSRALLVLILQPASQQQTCGENTGGERHAQRNSDRHGWLETEIHRPHKNVVVYIRTGYGEQAP